MTAVTLARKARGMKIESMSLQVVVSQDLKMVTMLSTVREFSVCSSEKSLKMITTLGQHSAYLILKLVRASIHMPLGPERHHSLRCENKYSALR